jgi:hypothetical protein
VNVIVAFILLVAGLFRIVRTMTLLIVNCSHEQTSVKVDRLSVRHVSTSQQCTKAQST